MSHLSHLQTALHLAAKGQGQCAPNPAVGAVVVKDNLIIGEGYHHGPGTAHAEVNALRQAGDKARGATLYVTLEPCNHEGRTPPCTDAIIDAGIAELIYAFKDPNHNVAGNGAAALQHAGVCVHHQPVVDIDLFYHPYAYWLQHGRPFVTVKIAISLDSKIANADRTPLAISGASAHEYTHQARAQADAILTTQQTITKDDPQLNARLAGKTQAKKLYILDRQLQLQQTHKVWKTASSITLFHSERHADTAQHTEAGARCLPISEDASLLDLPSILKQIGQDGIQQLWVEPGQRLLNSLLKNNLVNRLIVYVAPKFAGPDALAAFIGHAPTAKKQHWQLLGEDAMLQLDF
jgi:diaminohydroxyphosphoribosylaminopyrimidine deaminase / 5-amino-6-(5-phosphoribosylamino)uracil reductase